MSALIREFHTVQAIGFTNSLDSYGQKVLAQSSPRSIQMSVFDYSADNVADVRMVDVIKFGLTRDSVAEGEHIVDSSNTYYITKIMGNGKYKQVFMRLV